MLEREEIPLNRIDIFVANREELRAYREVLGSGYNLIVGVPGIHRQREFIHNYYPEGARLLCIDDDVRRIRTLYPGVPLDILVERMFELAAEAGCRLFGIYPNDSGLNLRDRAVIGHTFIIGCFFGMVNVRGIQYPHPTTEDWFRTLTYSLLDGKVMRFEGLGPTTSYCKEPGGLQTYRTAERQEIEMRHLAGRWPRLLRLRHKSGRFVDVQMRRARNVVVEDPFDTRCE